MIDNIKINLDICLKCDECKVGHIKSGWGIVDTKKMKCSKTEATLALFNAKYEYKIENGELIEKGRFLLEYQHTMKITSKEFKYFNKFCPYALEHIIGNT